MALQIYSTDRNVVDSEGKTGPLDANSLKWVIVGPFDVREIWSEHSDRSRCYDRLTGRIFKTDGVWILSKRDDTLVSSYDIVRTHRIALFQSMLRLTLPRAKDDATALAASGYPSSAIAFTGEETSWYAAAEMEFPWGGGVARGVIYYASAVGGYMNYRLPSGMTAFAPAANWRLLPEQQRGSAVRSPRQGSCSVPSKVGRV